MEPEMNGWNELGIVNTIYEEDEDEDSSFSSVPSLQSTPSQLQKWSLNRRHDPDVVIYVQDSCFQLHKEALITRSTYLKRHLTEFPEITLSPPLNITAETFSLVTDFCYNNHVVITPFNVAALRTASELLGMTEVNGPGDENLRQKTEAYFRHAVAVNKDNALIVLRSCLKLLPASEITASLVSRCIEALCLTAEVDGDLRCLDDVKGLRIEDLQLILESMSERLTDCHDLLYKIIDFYLKEHNAKVSEDQKIKMCNQIDCSILSPRLLMHAVQNPKMPLRFVVQAMFVEQLNTRHSIISAADQRATKPDKKDAFTLGAILQRDAALRQVSHLRATMSATSSRIQTLEKELSGMKKILSDSGRAASCRFNSESSSKVEKGQMGSISSSGFRNVRRVEASSSSEESSDGGRNVERKLGHRLMRGLKSVFGLQKKKCESKGTVKIEKNGEKLVEEDDDEGNIVIIRKDRAFHRRSRSQS